ncbi:MAG: hypothetical protein R6X31_07735 [Anaerolineae bacterium]
MRLRSERERRAESFDWTLWLKWILASTLGWLTGWALTNQFVIGVVVGVMQWLVLRPLVREDGWWIPASAAGWAGSVALVILILRPQNSLVAPVLLGAGIGLTQWLVLRWQLEQAWWWIVLSTLGWAIGMMGILGASLAGAAAGAVTGVALEHLLRHPKSQAQKAEGTATGTRDHSDGMG